MKRILFVDDEPMVLQGLQRMLHGMRAEWDMRFAPSGPEALRLMAEQAADVVVSDMRMPGMNGAELLNEIMRRHPKTVRFILSGFADNEMVMQCVGGTHQFLSKPCDGETLRSVLRRAMDMDPWLNSDRVKTLVSGMRTVPSLPSLYFQILEELRAPEASLDRVGETIARDPAMTAKMLQLANSAFFGLRCQLSNPTEAVMQLGLETVKSLVLTIHVFAELESGSIAREQIEQIYHHSLATANAARLMARLDRLDARTTEESFTAGLLHDIGRLALVANLPAPYAEVHVRSRKDALPLVEAERAVLGVTHAEVGGYLLGLWGLPVPIVEATVFHHAPSECHTRTFAALTAVHAANILVHESDAAPTGPRAQLDETYLTEAGVWGRIPVWRQALAKT